jgi:hypothetical protein
MRASTTVRNARKAFLVVALLGGLIVFPGDTVGAVGANVQATICGVDSHATATIETPVSDSIVVSPSVILSGTVTHATGIEIKVDDVYNSTVPLASTSTSYSSVVMLQPGTHTISLQANDICLARNGTATVVVTYQPSAQGPDVTAQTTAGGVAIGVGSVASTRTSLASVNPISTVVRALDLDTIAQDGVAKAVARVGLLLSGLATTTIGASIAGHIALQSGEVRHVPRRRRVVRICGFVPMFLALMI